MTAIVPMGQVGSPGPAAFPRQAETDEQLIRLWLHGRPETTVRAYQFDADRFRAFAGKPLRMITVGDVQGFADSIEHLADASRARAAYRYDQKPPSPRV